MGKQIVPKNSFKRKKSNLMICILEKNIIIKTANKTKIVTTGFVRMIKKFQIKKKK